MNYKNLLIHGSNALFLNCIMLVACAESEQKTLQFIPVKKTTSNQSIIPFNRDFFHEIQKCFDIAIFVETGTYLGDTSAIAAMEFKQVHTVELSDELFRQACHRFNQNPQIFLYQGDSGTVLTHMLSQIEVGPRIAILLDSHWSGGITARGADVPILRELDAIKKSNIKNAVILIDDIRCFQKQPPESPDQYQYPELSTIIERIHAIDPNYTCIVYGDILLAYTDRNITVPAIIQAMTMSRLDQNNTEMLSQAEAIIADALDEDFYHLSHLANVLDISTGSWRTHYYDFWYALALYKHGNKDVAHKYIMQAAHLGFHRAQYYLGLWK